MSEGIQEVCPIRIVVLGFERDLEILEKLSEYLKAKIVLYEPDIWKNLFEYDCIVAYMPSGIVIRGICPYLRGKWVDPAIVVVNKGLDYAVPILGGHHGGNEVAKFLENFGLKAVITTAMEYTEGLSVGIGCRKGIKAEEVVDAILRSLDDINSSLEDVRVIATAEIKKDESGIKGAADILKKPLMFARKEDINSTSTLTPSKATSIGLQSVAEACSLIFSREKKLILPKRVYGGVTIAISR
jgi:cobalt-precorrin 5A hydrolase